MYRLNELASQFDVLGCELFKLCRRIQQLKSWRRQVLPVANATTHHLSLICQTGLPNWAAFVCLCLSTWLCICTYEQRMTSGLCRLDSFQHFLNMAWWSGEGLTLYGLYISFYAILVPLFPSTSVPEFLAKICQKSSRPCLQSQMLRTRTLTVFPQHGNPILSALFECVQCALSQSAFCSAFIPENLLMGMRGITWCACWLVNESCCHEVAATFRQWLKEKKKFEDSGAFDQQWPAFSGRMRSHRTQLFHIFHTVRMMTLRIRWRFWQMDPALTLDRSVTVVTGSPRPIWQGWKITGCNGQGADWNLWVWRVHIGWHNVMSCHYNIWLYISIIYYYCNNLIINM